jgi:hypothetical protein
MTIKFIIYVRHFTKSNIQSRFRVWFERRGRRDIPGLLVAELTGESLAQ